MAATRYIVAKASSSRCRHRPLPSSAPRRSRWGPSSASWREPFVPPGPPDVEESIAAFVRRRLGTEFSTTRSTPLSPASMRETPSKISMSAAVPRLHALEQKYGSLIKGQIKGARERRRSAEKAKNTAGSFSFRRGMQTLTDALARAVGARRDRRARRADRARRRRQLEPRRHPRRSTHRAAGARAWVLAVPAYEAAKLVRELAPAATQGLAASPVCDDRERRHRLSARRRRAFACGFRLPRAEAGAAPESSARCSRAACSTVAPPRERCCSRPSSAALRHAALPARPDAELAAIVHGELGRSAGARGEPLWVNYHALDARHSAIQSRPPRASATRGGGGARAARPVLLRQLSGRSVRGGLHQIGAGDGRNGHAAISARAR